MRKCNSEEKLGLTVCYSSGSSSEEADNCTEVYIRDIIPKSVADRDGRLKQGDQILQVFHTYPLYYSIVLRLAVLQLGQVSY